MKPKLNNKGGSYDQCQTPGVLPEKVMFGHIEQEKMV